jgi:NADH-quinone oxidoreductase E subunit
MSAAAKTVEQPKSFAFTPDNLLRAQAIIAKYPATRAQSALLPLLQLAQAQHENWLPRAAMDAVAAMLELPPIRAYEVATFYTMFNRAPVGKHFIQICTTTPCWLRGSDAIKQSCKDKLGLSPGETSADGQFSVVEVECLGACVNAPMVQINDDYYEDLDAELMGKIIDDLKAGKPVTQGSQTGRRGSCAQNGPTSLQNRSGQ